MYVGYVGAQSNINTSTFENLIQQCCNDCSVGNVKRGTGIGTFLQARFAHVLSIAS